MSKSRVTKQNQKNDSWTIFLAIKARIIRMNKKHCSLKNKRIFDTVKCPCLWHGRHHSAKEWWAFEGINWLKVLLSRVMTFWIWNDFDETFNLFWFLSFYKKNKDKFQTLLATLRVWQWTWEQNLTDKIYKLTVLTTR